MRKRFITFMMSVVMTITLLAGCGGKDGNQETQKENAGQGKQQEETAELKEYTLAVPFPESGIISFEALRVNMDILEEKTKGNIVNAPADMTPDGVLTFVENQVAAGVDGIIIIPPADSILPSVAAMCEEAQIYWGIAFRSISDEEIKKVVEASPYYVGNCFENEEEAGYTTGKWVGEQGYKKIAIISLPKGDATADARERGLQKACEEYDIEIVGEAREQSQASDAAAATESFLAANPDLDAIFYVSSASAGTHEATVKAIQDAGRADDVKVVSIDFPDGIAADFESGVLIHSYGISCSTLDPFITTVKVINAIQGTPISDDGSFTTNNISMFAIEDVETAKKYQDIVGNPEYIFYNDDELDKLFKWENPNLSEATLQEILDAYNPFE